MIYPMFGKSASDGGGSGGGGEITESMSAKHTLLGAPPPTAQLKDERP